MAEAELGAKLKREITDDDLYSHLMYPQVFADFVKFTRDYSDVSVMPTTAFFYGLKPGEEISVRESSKNNPMILSARDATAHAPSPSWMDVDRDSLKGRINSVPRRDELTQIPINEQLYL